MPSNYTYACFNCRKAWKGGGTCGCPDPNIECMGTKWRAPRASQDRVWKKMQQDREAGVKGWSLWDTQTIDSVQQSKRVRSPMTHEEKLAHKAKIAKARINIENFYLKYQEELAELLQQVKDRHTEVRRRINQRRKHG